MTSESSIIRPAMLTGLFRERRAAEQAYDAAVALGYEAANINVVMSEETRRAQFANDLEEPPDAAADVAAWHSGRATKAAPGDPSQQPSLEDQAAVSAEIQPKSAELGGPLGGAAGVMAPVLAAAGTLLLIPGVIIAGPVAAALTAAGAVGIAGGIAGALADWGIPKKRLQEYESDIHTGGILLGVRPRSDEDRHRLAQAWRASGGELAAS